MNGATFPNAPRKVMPERFLAILKSPAEGIIALFAVAFTTLAGGLASESNDGGMSRYIISGIVSVIGLAIIYGIRLLIERNKTAATVHHDITEAGTKSQEMHITERRDFLTAQNKAIEQVTASFKEILAQQRESFMQLQEAQRKDFETQIREVREEKHRNGRIAQAWLLRFITLCTRAEMANCDPSILFAPPLHKPRLREGIDEDE
jgi:hypothetical protein